MMLDFYFIEICKNAVKVMITNALKSTVRWAYHRDYNASFFSSFFFFSSVESEMNSSLRTLIFDAAKLGAKIFNGIHVLKSASLQ